MLKENRPTHRTVDGWALALLLEAGAIHECEEHGWAKDSTDPHAREHAIVVARQHPPSWHRAESRSCGGGRWLRAPSDGMLDWLADLLYACRQSALQKRLSPSRRSRIVPESTKCIWRASLPTWTKTGHLLLLQRSYGFYVLMVSTLKATLSPIRTALNIRPSCTSKSFFEGD